MKHNIEKLAVTVIMNGICTTTPQRKRSKVSEMHWFGTVQIILYVNINMDSLVTEIYFLMKQSCV